MFSEEYFGNPGKISMMRRSAALNMPLHDDPRYACYGWAYALSGASANTFELMRALAQLQGVGICKYFPKADAAALFSRLEAEGFTTDRHEHYRGGEAALDASRHILTSTHMPADLTVQWLDDSSPSGLVAAVAGLLQDSEVMPMPGSFLRGNARPGITLVAIDRAGDPVASASSFIVHHRANLHASDVFLGMMATRADRRGEKIALQLAALAIEHMWLNHGARGFITGVRHDNFPCRRSAASLACTTPSGSMRSASMRSHSAVRQ